jgi:hypothetical protein
MHLAWTGMTEKYFAATPFSAVFRLTVLMMAAFQWRTIYSISAAIKIT